MCGVCLSLPMLRMLSAGVIHCSLGRRTSTSLRLTKATHVFHTLQPLPRKSSIILSTRSSFLTFQSAAQATALSLSENLPFPAPPALPSCAHTHPARPLCWPPPAPFLFLPARRACPCPCRSTSPSEEGCACCPRGSQEEDQGRRIRSLPVAVWRAGSIRRCSGSPGGRAG